MISHLTIQVLPRSNCEIINYHCYFMGCPPFHGLLEESLTTWILDSCFHTRVGRQRLFIGPPLSKKGLLVSNKWKTSDRRHLLSTRWSQLRSINRVECTRVVGVTSPDVYSTTIADESNGSNLKKSPAPRPWASCPKGG